MAKGPDQKRKLLLERCESGRIGLTANELTWVTGSEGSNPSLSARAGHEECPGQKGPSGADGPAVPPVGWWRSGARRVRGREPVLAADPGLPEEPS